MLNQAITQINAKLSDLCWTDNLCGLTTLARKETKTVKGNTTEIYPVSCGCDQTTCWQTGKYKELVPNGNFKSTVYWDQVGALTPVTNSRLNAKKKQFEVDLKLVMWFNLKKLGKADCGFCHEAYSDLIMCSMGKIPSDDQSVGSIKMERVSMDSQEQTRSFFRKYAYGDKERVFFYPYEACTINVKLSFIIGVNCLEPATCGVEIEC